MSRRAYMLLAGAVAAVAILFLLPSNEPVYQGKSLSDWVVAMHGGKAPERQKARAVVHQLGTNSLPLLLRWLQQPDRPSFRSRVARAKLSVADWLEARKLLSRHTPRLGMDWKNSYRFLAVEAFNELGPDATPALPGLIRLLADKGSTTNEVSDTAGFAYIVLRRMSPASIPALTQALASPDSQVWSLAAEALADMGPEARPALPLLRPRLSDPDPALRLEAAEAMARLGGDAAEFVPVVIGTLAEPDSESLSEKLSLLVQYKAQAQSAVPVLEQLLARIPATDTPDHRSTRYLLTNALAQLRPQP